MANLRLLTILIMFILPGLSIGFSSAMFIVPILKASNP